MLYTHVAAGVLSLIVAPIAMVVRKGGTAHRASGRIFFWAMTWIFLSALVLATYRFNLFLLMISVFSYYNVVIGYRSVYQKQLHLRKGVKWYDWTTSVVALGFNVVFVVLGIMGVADKSGGFASYLALVFGGGGISLAIRTLNRFVRPSTDKHSWLYSHVGYMIGGFIASLTAFSANVIHFLPGMWQWLWPSVVLVPVIIYVNRYYRRKISAGARLTDLVELKR